MDLFRTTFGVGDNGSINFYKYSPQRECFVGFDQAYVKTELSESQFFDLLRNSAANAAYRISEKFVGYFLQFKVVSEMQRRRKYTPTGITGRPHYRASLDTTRNINTGLSQHELLYNLSRNSGAMVYYACPMVFERSALYEIDVDLNTLRLVDLGSCPSAYADNDNHFIYFNDRHGDPVWCSEPVDGRAASPRELAETVRSRLNELDPRDSAMRLLQLLLNLEAAGLAPESEALRERAVPSILSLVAESMSILRVKTPTLG